MSARPPPGGWQGHGFAQKLREKLLDVREAHALAGEPHVEEEPLDPGQKEHQSAIRHLRACDLPELSVEWIDEHGIPALMQRPPGKRLQDFMGGPATVAVLEGVTGSGKTTLSAIALLHAREVVQVFIDEQPQTVVNFRPGRCMFYCAYDFRRVAERWGGFHDILERVERVPILVLDDLASTDEDDPTTAELTQTVLVKRHDRKLKTVITTNSKLETLKERYRARVGSRLELAIRIPCGGSDFRRQVA